MYMWVAQRQFFLPMAAGPGGAKTLKNTSFENPFSLF